MRHLDLRSVVLLLCFASGLSPALPARAAAPAVDSADRPIYAQRLVDRTVKAHPGMLDLIVHVTPPGKPDNVTIAAFTEKERGQKSGDDDMSVVNGGAPLVEVQKDGVRVGIVVQLKDRAGAVIGALGAVYVYKTGEDPQMFLHKTEHLRDQLARRIASRDALFSTAG